MAGAGQKAAIVIATNMAGRGTDIKLGKDLDLAAPEAGLQIIGTERHESRRIDRQLRGRSGRQGDPGQTIFFLSLEDDLMRLFGSDRIARWMDKSGAEEGEVITGGLVTRAIEQAQKRVELQNFHSGRLLESDVRIRREVIYSCGSSPSGGRSCPPAAPRVSTRGRESQFPAAATKPEDRPGGLREADPQYLAHSGSMSWRHAVDRSHGQKPPGVREETFRRKDRITWELRKEDLQPEGDSRCCHTVMLCVLDETLEGPTSMTSISCQRIQYRPGVEGSAGRVQA